LSTKSCCCGARNTCISFIVALYYSTEIVTLKSKGAIKEVSSCSNEFLSNIFLVPKKTVDMRPVIKLKPFNVFVQKIHFKMENINTAFHTIAPGDYLVSLDLKETMSRYLATL